MSKKIEVRLSDSGINSAIKELKAYQKWVEQKTQLLTEKLAILGAGNASVRFARATYDGENDSQVSVSKTSNGWVIRAEGNAVFFIEFGAGVYFNGAEPYPKPRPPMVDKIGEYGQGKGKRNSWGYYDEGGELHITRGTPAAMPMYYAAVEMERELLRIAKEVFR